MPLRGSKTTAASRTRTGRRLAAAIALLATGCSEVSPYIEHYYVRAGAPVLYEPVHTIEHDASGPFYGGSIAFGSIVEQAGRHATALEIEYAYRRLGNQTELDGFDHAFFGGVRRFWNLDGRVRPHAGFGATWETFHVRAETAGDDPAGMGLYADVGIDYLFTPLFALGVRLRDAARYEYADANHGIRNGVEFALIATWNF